MTSLNSRSGGDSLYISANFSVASLMLKQNKDSPSVCYLCSQSGWATGILLKPGIVIALVILRPPLPAILPRLHGARFKPHPFLFFVQVEIAGFLHVFAMKMQGNITLRATLSFPQNEGAAAAWTAIIRWSFPGHT